MKLIGPLDCTIALQVYSLSFISSLILLKFKFLEASSLINKLNSWLTPI